MSENNSPVTGDNQNSSLEYQKYVERQQKKKEDFLGIINAQSNDITRENANMNADTPAGMMMKFASEASKEFVDDELLSPEVLEYVNNNILHIHDKDYYPTKSLTCVQTPLDNVLETGFVTGHASIRPAKHIETASMLACISMETSQNEMHGGQAIPSLDFYLAPYVRLTYIEELKKIEQLEGESYEEYYYEAFKDYTKKELGSLVGIERIKQAAMNQTVRRVHQSMESFVHNMNNIHSRGGNQVVFSSCNYGTDTSAEGRCIIRELLNTTYEGVGNGETAIFPIQIWKVKTGVNYLPNDPNYDLYQFACKVTARRFFPNFLNLDASFNQDDAWVATDPKRYEHEVATMGCVDGKSKIMVLDADGGLVKTSIEKVWRMFAKEFDVHSQTEEGFEGGEYIDLENVKIDDCGEFVDCLRIIKNPDKGDWYKVVLDDGKELICTADHPWSVNVPGGIAVLHTEQLKVSDIVTVVNDKNVESSEIAVIEFIGSRDEYSYDVTTSSEHFTVNDIRSHNCRTRVFENRFGTKTSIGRGNLSFSTINIVRLAIQCMNIEDKDARIEEFFKKLDKALCITAKQLDERYQFQKTALAKQFPLLMSKLWIGAEKLNPNEPVGDIINQGTLGIGFIGLAECLKALTGKHHGESKESQKLGLKIVTYMRDKVNEFSEQYKHNYSVLATPAEGLAGKFTKIDQKEFGKIPGVTDRDYYTNSSHVPVYYKISAKKKAEIEGPYHNLERGGHIFYVEIDGDATHNPEVVMGVVDLMHKYDMGYGSINHNRNRCMDCGYENADKNMTVCPKCGSHNIDTLQRITGYLVGTTSRWNHGKLSELRDRTTHEMTENNTSEDK